MADEKYVTSLYGEQIDDALLQMHLRAPEGWTQGTRDGVDVDSSSIYYHNNAKYYAENAANSAARAEGAIPAGTAGAVFFDRAQSLTDAQKVQARSNISAGQGGTNPNLIDNPWFTVNQRGITSLTGSGYIADRWNAPWGQATYTANSDGSITIGHGRESQFLQRIALPPNSLAGKTITLSLMLGDGTIGSWTLTVPSGAADVISTSFGGRAIGFSSAASGTAYGYTLWIYTSPSSTTDFTLKAAKLEIGSISTLANDAPPNYAEELLKCQHYFYASRIRANVSSARIMLAFGWVASTDGKTVCLFVPTPVPMRNVPQNGASLASGGFSFLNPLTGAYLTYQTGSITVLGQTSAGVTIQTGANAAITTPFVVAYTGGGGGINLSADL